MTSIRCGHIGLTCADIERSKKFYSEVFGFEPFFEIRRNTPWLAARVGYENADISFCHMRGAGGMHLELLQYHHPRYWPDAALPDDTYIPGNVHVNFWVEDAHAVAQRCIQWWFRNEEIKGLSRFATEGLCIDSTTITDGPQRGGKGFYMRDPDGHTIEIMEEANGLTPEISKVIDRLEAARVRQNTNWMDVVRTIYRVAPEEGHRLFKKIEDQDREINSIAAESHR